ncbi:hypothetical protein [Streptomyces roseochromogenus]|nr:hypothetical protein [Streptomyces roseochromogenus]
MRDQRAVTRYTAQPHHKPNVMRGRAVRAVLQDSSCANAVA